MVINFGMRFVPNMFDGRTICSALNQVILVSLGGVSVINGVCDVQMQGIDGHQEILLEITL